MWFSLSQQYSFLKVINEELVAKITENANLRMKLGDIETTFEATVQVFNKAWLSKEVSNIPRLTILESSSFTTDGHVLLPGFKREV